MQNENKSLHWGFGALALVIALVTYLLTVQPTVPFWDCGEFTAAAVQQQVPHPPGAPLFLMLGKLFHLIPFGDDGWRVNLLSVFSSAITVLLLYLITVKIIRNFFREPLHEFGNALLVYGSAFVSAMVYTYSDTNWFNAVESEVYAASSLFVAIILWLMMVWNEKADDAGSERYLLLIAYLIGLSIGVHLLSILTIFSLVLLIYLRKYPVRPTTLLLTLGIGLVTFYVTYNLIIMKLPAFFAGTLPFFRSEAREYAITDSVFVQIIGVGILLLAAWGAWYGRKTGHGVLSLTTTSFLLIVLGYSTYGHLLVRSNSNPPMNENKPDNFEKLVSYLGREQYGEAPMWPRRYQTDERFVVHYRKYDGAGPTQRWTPPPIKGALRKDGTQAAVPDYSKMKVHTAGELAYLWDYQIDQMYLRYFAWNFIGRISDEQNAPSAFLPSSSSVEVYNHGNGQKEHFPIRLFAIPFLLGLIGLIFHFVRDPKMAWVWFVGFLMMGVLAAIQQNQQNPQPRERDYFYVGSFMIWAMWSGLGVFALLEKMRNNVGVVGGGILASLVVAPLNMAVQQWHTHSRAGNYMAFDYAYNILQSLDQDAIVFTNGDNDTFPVWYLQDVAGVRRDVRVVNLSLGQTTWYVEQLKNREPFNAKRIPLSFSDESLSVPEDDRRALSYTFGPARQIVVNVDRDILKKFTTDTTVINRGTMSWMFKGRQRGNNEYFFGVQHRLVADIIEQTRFTRPIYFSTSVGDPSWADEYCGLDNYLRLEGMAFRVCPAPQRSAIGEGVNDEYMWNAIVESKYATNDDFSLTPAVGLKFRNLANKDVYYDDVHRGYMMNYRNVFYKYAMYVLSEKRDTARAGKIMNKMNELISIDMFPLGIMYEYQFASFYDICGMKKERNAMAERLLASADAMINNAALKDRDRTYNDQRMPAERIAAEACKMLERWDQAKRYYGQMLRLGKDPVLLFMIDEIDIDRKLASGDTEGALSAAEALLTKYPMQGGGQRDMEAAMALQSRIQELRTKLGKSAEPIATTMLPGN